MRLFYLARTWFGGLRALAAASRAFKASLAIAASRTKSRAIRRGRKSPEQVAHCLGANQQVPAQVPSTPDAQKKLTFPASYFSSTSRCNPDDKQTAGRGSRGMSKPEHSALPPMNRWDHHKGHNLLTHYGCPRAPPAPCLLVKREREKRLQSASWQQAAQVHGVLCNPSCCSLRFLCARSLGVYGARTAPNFKQQGFPAYKAVWRDFSLLNACTLRTYI